MKIPGNGTARGPCRVRTLGEGQLPNRRPRAPPTRTVPGVANQFSVPDDGAGSILRLRGPHAWCRLPYRLARPLLRLPFIPGWALCGRSTAQHLTSVAGSGQTAVPGCPHSHAPSVRRLLPAAHSGCRSTTGLPARRRGMRTPVGARGPPAAGRRCRPDVPRSSILVGFATMELTLLAHHHCRGRHALRAQMAPERGHAGSHPAAAVPDGHPRSRGGPLGFLQRRNGTDRRPLFGLGRPGVDGHPRSRDEPPSPGFAGPRRRVRRASSPSVHSPIRSRTS